jgi:hypothetical protein
MNVFTIPDSTSSFATAVPPRVRLRSPHGCDCWSRHRAKLAKVFLRTIFSSVCRFVELRPEWGRTDRRLTRYLTGRRHSTSRSHPRQSSHSILACRTSIVEGWSSEWTHPHHYVRCSPVQRGSTTVRNSERIRNYEMSMKGRDFTSPQTVNLRNNIRVVSTISI